MNNAAAVKLENEKEKILKEYEGKPEHDIMERQLDAIVCTISQKAEEDFDLTLQIVQKHKTLDRCFKHLLEQAKKFQLKGKNFAMVDDQTVYSWVWDYYALDDKAKIEADEKKAAEEKKKMEERKASVSSFIPKPVEKPKETQMSLFDLL